MRRLLQTAFAVSAVAVALVANADRAAADDFTEYRRAMKDFGPVINDWLGEVDAYSAAAKSKPEILQDAALSDLAARGHSIAGDLVGTVAPGTYADSHATLTAAIEALASAADDAPAADGSAFASAIADDMSAARTALRDIYSYAVRRGKGTIDLPVPPVMGN